MNIVVAVVLGAIVGGILGVVEHAIWSKASPRMRRVGHVAIVLLTLGTVGGLVNSGLAGSIATRLTGSQSSKSAQQSPQEAFGNRVLSDPQLTAVFQGMTADEARLKGSELSSKGIARLDDATLARRAQLLALILNKVSEPTCAAIARGNATASQQQELLDTIDGLSASDQTAWYNISFAAVKAEVAQTPAPSLDSTSIAGVLDAAKSNMSAADSSAVTATLGGTATDAQACVGVKALYHQATTMSSSQGQVLTRALATS